MDVLSYRVSDFLVAVCIVSSFAWIVKLRRKGAKDLAAALWHFVCHWGAPSLLKSDGATGFTAHAFEKFCKEFGILRVLTSAYNAPSNDSPERMVLEVKQLIKKGGHRDLDLLMRILNSKARPRNRGTPLTLMLGRACNGYLPNQINEDLKLLENFCVRQQEADEYAKARGRTSRYDWKVGDQVYRQDIKTKKWDIRGKVVDKRPASDGSSPRSFLVEGDLGGTYLGNATYLCPAPEVSEENESADT